MLDVTISWTSFNSLLKLGKVQPIKFERNTGYYYIDKEILPQNYNSYEKFKEVVENSFNDSFLFTIDEPIENFE